MTDDQVFIEVNCQQKHIEGERICGDVFLSAKLREEGLLSGSELAVPFRVIRLPKRTV